MLVLLLAVAAMLAVGGLLVLAAWVFGALEESRAARATGEHPRAAKRWAEHARSVR